MLEICCWLVICSVCGAERGAPTEDKAAARRHGEQTGWLLGASGALCPWCVCRLDVAAVQTAATELSVLAAAA